MKKQTTHNKNILGMALAAVLSLSVAACASNPDAAHKSHAEISDPFEPVNRAVFGFNNVLDLVIIEPVAKVYRFVTPQVVQNSIQSFMRNLKSPIIVANNLLQGDIGGAGVATARFAINSTLGFAGLADVAETQGLPYEPEDFGQTLAVWGMPSGPYLVLPVLGPSNIRDTAGLVVDAYADPVRIVAFNTDNEWIYYTRGAVEGLDTRARLLETVEDLRRNSLDYYASVRSIYGQKRHSLVKDERNGSVAIPDFDDENY